ncbi:MMGT1 [Lepeophtheirus salmonis]|uniref:Membrane magnesium transporter n=1 Tax=Lepeophtheirus salmonis TaxID=72036 RepID=A0A7R8CQZ0_LEPSM|nr:MMGT1 [Lepeophtheirus salmonis]CAF2900053.1 MMGT1 [Lepeophtheirus salmonis]
MGNWESGMHYLLALSILVVLHAAYSAAEWRARRKHEDPGEQEEDLPLDIVLQTLIGLASAMVGVVHVSGSFKEIRATVELAQRNWENTRNRSSFYIFNHRGKAFSPTLRTTSISSRYKTKSALCCNRNTSTIPILTSAEPHTFRFQSLSNQ